MTLQRTYSPIHGELIDERPLASQAQIEGALSAASHTAWSRVPLAERILQVSAFVDAVMAQKTRLADELTLQMGRPRRYAEGELGGFEERARRMIELAPESLKRIGVPAKPGFRRYMTRVPLGPVLILSPWNYPWLTTVNALVPALLAGNPVVLKHSDQTPLVAERLREAAQSCGLETGAFSILHMNHDQVAATVADPRVAHVCFTGSVEGGHAVVRAAADRFIGLGLELGGKDPAYVAADADLEFAVENLVDGSFFNSGQSCCGVERIYVHRSHYDTFLERFIETTQDYILGDPRDETTTLGPVVRERSAKAITAQVNAAVEAGAVAHIGAPYAGSERGPAYLGPQVLTRLKAEMSVMQEETFGPVACITPVDDDEDAIRRMNHSRYGLTASIWTGDLDRAAAIGEQLETGTVFANRCDALDPDLAWVGVKDSGRGATLSTLGFEHLTRPKSFHLREPVSHKS